MTVSQKKMLEYQNVVKDVEEFITYFDGTQDNFLNGNCYWFAVILNERLWQFYPLCRIVYNQVDNHFAIMIRLEDDTTFLFDASGYIGHYDKDKWVLFDDYQRNEPLDAARVWRDCIWHMSEEEWKALPQKAREAPWYYVKPVKTRLSSSFQF